MQRNYRGFAALLIAVLTPLAPLQAQSNYATPYSITTFFGSGSADGTSTPAQFYWPQTVAADGAGNLYVAESGNHTIRKVTPAGVVTTLAGSSSGYGTADGTGSAARFYRPNGIAVDSSGNLYVADAGNNAIRKITPAGVVTTFAGSLGHGGSTDGTGDAARFIGPTGLAMDSAENLYVADTFNCAIRKITPAGVVTTFAGSLGLGGWSDGTGNAARFSSPNGLAVDHAANLYVSDSVNNTVRKITPAGVVTTLAGSAFGSGAADGVGSDARFKNPTGVAVDGTGNVFIADSGNSTIRKITPAGAVTTLAGDVGGTASVDGIGTAARFNLPTGVAVDTANNVYIADRNNHTIRRITPAGDVTTHAGSSGNPGSADGTRSAAQLNKPSGLAVAATGFVYVAESANHTICKITPAGVITTFAGVAGNPGTADGSGSAARFNTPHDLVLDYAGNLYIADSANCTIRKISPAGEVTTLAGAAGSPGSVDGTGGTARFNSPQGVAVDGAGNVYVADSNCTIRKISPAGVVTTVAGSAGVSGSSDGTGSSARFNSPAEVAVDRTGNLYIADTANSTIRKIATDGVVTTLAGTAGTIGSADEVGQAARFANPAGIAVDSAGNLFIADTGNNTIRRIAPTGTVTTLAGTRYGSGSDDGEGGSARFNQPAGIEVDGAGVVYVADSGNNKIRRGAIKPSFTIQPSSQSANSGNGVSFSASAEGGPVATLGWQVSKDGGLTWDNLANDSAYSGATTSTLGIGSANASMHGWRYRCVATNGGGSVTSSYATLIVRPNAVSGEALTIDSFDVARSAQDITGGNTSMDDYGTSIAGGHRNVYIRNFAPANPISVTYSVQSGRLNYTTFTQYDDNNYIVLLYGNLPAATQLHFDLSGMRASGGFQIQLSEPAPSYAIDVSFFSTSSWGTFSSRNNVASDRTVIIPFTSFRSSDFSAPDSAFADIALVEVTFKNLAAAPGKRSISIETISISASTSSLVPSINTQPVAQAVATGNTASFSIVASGSPAPNLQWQVSTDGGSNWSNVAGSAYSGATTATLAITGATLAMNGYQYRCVANNSAGSVTSAGATLTVAPTALSRLINLSTRARVGTGAEVLIPGFVISGAPKKLLIRAVGPSLEPYGISNFLPDPVLELKTLSGTLITTNDDWNPVDAAAMTQVGAFSLPASSRDAAVVVTLDPGMYTAVVSDKTGRQGIGLVELYDLEPSSGKLINISTRARVGVGAEVLIPGVVVDGNAKKRLLIRAAGPALLPYGINDFLPDPIMEIKTLAGVSVTTNDNWNSVDPTLTAAFATAGAFAFTPGSRDAALVVELDPGLYTVVVKGVGDTTGVALVEVYELP